MRRQPGQSRKVEALAPTIRKAGTLWKKLGGINSEISVGLQGVGIVRNLDKGNPSIAHPRHMGAICAFLPFLLGGMCAILASEATPHQPWISTPLAKFCLYLCPAAIISAIVPKAFNWDWRAKYFGFSSFHFASASLLGIVPWLCILLYGAPPAWEKALLFLFYVVPIIWWCRRFVTLYRKIYNDKDLRALVYIEEPDAVYYIQKNDSWLIEKKYKFKVCPANLLIIIPMASAFLLTPWMRTVRIHVGLPFPHVFLTIACLPIVMMILGLVVKCYLVYYYYPRMIKSETGKEVFVDMFTKTIPTKKKK